jgi:hypothetical protein
MKNFVYVILFFLSISSKGFGQETVAQSIYLAEVQQRHTGYNIRIASNGTVSVEDMSSNEMRIVLLLNEEETNSLSQKIAQLPPMIRHDGPVCTAADLVSISVTRLGSLPGMCTSVSNSSDYRAIKSDIMKIANLALTRFQSK